MPLPFSEGGAFDISPALCAGVVDEEARASFEFDFTSVLVVELGGLRAVFEGCFWSSIFRFFVVSSS